MVKKFQIIEKYKDLVDKEFRDIIANTKWTPISFFGRGTEYFCLRPNHPYLRKLIFQCAEEDSFNLDDCKDQLGASFSNIAVPTPVLCPTFGIVQEVDKLTFIYYKTGELANMRYGYLIQFCEKTEDNLDPPVRLWSQLCTPYYD